MSGGRGDGGIGWGWRRVVGVVVGVEMGVEVRVGVEEVVVGRCESWKEARRIIKSV